MAKKKATKKEGSKRGLLLEALKDQLPSSRSAIRCQGCFAPRKTLTVKHHEGAIWHTDHIIVDFATKTLQLKCHFCQELRFLGLSSFSWDVFQADWKDKTPYYALLKDDKYNSMVSVAEGIIPEEYTLIMRGERSSE